jgi:hypothetical protein
MIFALLQKLLEHSSCDQLLSVLVAWPSMHCAVQHQPKTGRLANARTRLLNRSLCKRLSYS